MNKDELIKMAKDPKYISGIYNYCDRWCERCEFTSRCLSFNSMEKELEKQTTSDFPDTEIWDKLHEVFSSTFEMIRDVAEENGVDIDELAEDLHDLRDSDEDDISSHKLSKGASEYAAASEEWFGKQQGILDAKSDELIMTAELDLPGADPEAEAESIEDCIEVIRWYQHQIGVKLARALIWTETGTEGDMAQDDADGSAKVALIGMDRSIEAWSGMCTHFPTKADDILDVLLLLDRLRKGTEDHFSGARAFIRPGFDTEPVPKSASNVSTSVSATHSEL